MHPYPASFLGILIILEDPSLAFEAVHLEDTLIIPLKVNDD